MSMYVDFCFFLSAKEMSEIHREGKVPTLGCVDSCYLCVCIYTEDFTPEFLLHFTPSLCSVI